MPEEYAVVPLSPIRNVIAARMTEAKRSVPHFRVVVDVEVDALSAMRQQLNVSNADGKCSLNDFLIKAAAMALMDVPEMNVQFCEDGLHVHTSADIAVVIALEDGLSTPIIRAAQRKSVGTISREVKELAAKAEKKTLRMDQICGGTFSISNLGMFGVDEFDAIINPPQCAILAVGAAKPRPIAGKHREVRIATMMRMTLSVDHRALDGAVAARFLTALRLRIERPESLIQT